MIGVVEQAYTTLSKPRSAIHFSLVASARAGIVSQDGDGDTLRSMKATARLVSIGIAAFFFAYWGILYNSALALPKKALSLTCRMIDRPILGYDADDYSDQFKLHLVFGIMDFIGNTFFYVIALGYMLFPRPTLYLTTSVIEMIETIGLTSPRKKLRDHGTQTDF